MNEALLAADIGLVVLVKATVVLAAAFGAVRVLRRSSAALRHAVWGAALATLVALPILPSPVPALEVNAALLLETKRPLSSQSTPVTTIVSAETASVAQGARGERLSLTEPAPTRDDVPAITGETSGANGPAIPLNPALLLLAVWALAASGLLMRFCFGYFGAWRMASRGESVEVVPCPRQVRIRRGVRIVRSSDVHMPVTFGLLAPVVLLPEHSRSWSADRLRIVLEHELAHVERFDYAVHVISQIALALYWPNPLVWMAVRRMRLEQEAACDDRVLTRGTASHSYAEHLLQIARGNARAVNAGAIALAHRHTLKERVRWILSGSVDRRPLSFRSGVVAAALALCIAIPLAALQPADPDDVRRSRAFGALLSESIDEVRTGLHYFRVESDSSAVAALAPLIRHDDQTIRLETVHAMAAQPMSLAAPYLILALGDESDLVAAAAAQALRRSQDLDVLAALEAFDRKNEEVDTVPKAEPEAVYLFLEAEEGILRLPMGIYAAQNVSAGGFVMVAEQDGHDAPDGGPGAVDLTFQLDRAGSYVVWGRVMSPSDSDNSFFVSINKGRELIWDVPGPEVDDIAKDWTWDVVSARDPETNQIANPIIYHLDAGTHQIRIRNREDGTRLDALVITNDMSYVPAGIAPRTPPEHPQYVWMQAEDGRLTHEMTTAADEMADGGRFIWVPDGDGNDAPDGGPAAATYEFAIESEDEFVIWARVRAPRQNDNSFFVTLSGQKELVWHAPRPGETTDQWTWARVPVRIGSDGESAFTERLEAGVHEISFRVREDGTQLDAMLVTNDHTFRPRGAHMIPPRRAAFLWREAEDADVTPPMAIESHREASAGSFIRVSGTNSRSSPPDEGFALYDFQVNEPGNYAFWGRVSIENNDRDSFWVRVNGGKWIRWNGIPAGRAWHWAELHDSDQGMAPVRFDLAEGVHKIEVRYREEGAMLDRLLLTNDHTYVPSGTGAASSGDAVTSSRIEVVF